jgi:DNA polymerase-3 subunit alpha
MTEYNHLHVHSEYSLLDGLSTPEEIAKIASQNGQSAIALTDHGVMGGILRFQKACQKHGVKPIHGCEFYMVPKISEDNADKDRERFHLIIHARNQAGLHKLFKLQKRSWTTGFYYKPRIDMEDIAYLGNDVVILSGCMAGIISQSLMSDEMTKADEFVDAFKAITDHFYIELQPWNSTKLNDQLVDLASTHDLKTVGTIDCHFPTKKEKGVEEVLLAIGTWQSMKASEKEYALAHSKEAKQYDDLCDRINCLLPNRNLNFTEHDLYLMDNEEAEERFAKYPGAIETTLEIAEKCNSELITGRSLLPEYSNLINSDDYLVELCEMALQELGVEKDDLHLYEGRLTEEMETIHRLKFSTYFLIIWDICNWADNQGIARGPGRGSSAGSLIAYLLGITKVDPVEHDLLFFRFISPDRNDFPDIDLDFADDRRGEVKQYSIEKWGFDYVSSITTYGTFGAKNTLKDTARVFGLPYKYVNGEISPLFNELEDLQESSTGRKFVKENPAIISTVKTITGRIRGHSAHPAGVVVSKIPLDEVVPLESRDLKESDERVLVTALDKDEVEELGLIKLDLLGLNAVTVINDTIRAIEERHGIDVEEASLGIDDPKVFANFNNKNVMGAFQVEGGGYKNLLSKMSIDSFKDLVVSNALVRPGSWETQGTTYLACRDGKSKPVYPHESVKPFLEDTFGTLIFEEQLMQMLVYLGGMSWSDADRFRKIISKKKDEAAFGAHKEHFFEGMTRKISRSEAQHLWDDILKACQYMFNKSHSTAYSNYPTEFMWSLLKNETGDTTLIGYILEAQRMGIKILPPDLNISNGHFTLDGDSIRYGLTAVHGVGKGAVSEILRLRPFSTMEELQNKCDKRKVNKTVIESLDKIGGLNNLDDHESQYEHALYYVSILGIPVYDENDPLNDVVTPCDVAQEDSRHYHVVRGIVKETKRTPKYFRVEIMDQSGSVSVFANTENAISKRDSIVALMKGNSLIDFMKVDDPDEEFSDFLFNKYLPKKHYLEDEDVPEKFIGMEGTPSLVYILSARAFKTKSNLWMASMYFWDGKEIQEGVVFPKQFDRMAEVLGNRKLVLIEWTYTKDGSVSIGDAISWKNWKKLKRKVK